ncbi:MAG TPA: hypothetical protein VGD91_30860 [Trebonia sp.]
MRDGERRPGAGRTVGGIDLLQFDAGRIDRAWSWSWTGTRPLLF